MSDWSDVIIATAGGAPQELDAGPGFDLSANRFTDIDLTGAGFTTAKLTANFDDYAFLLNTDLDESAIHWSDGENLSWAVSTTTAAGFYIARRLDTGINAAERLGPGIAVYGADAVSFIRWVGFPNYFEVDHLVNGIGVVSAKSVASIGRVHYGFGAKGLWAFDGSTFRYVGDDRVHDFVFGDMNRLALNLVCHSINTDMKTITWFWPGAGSPELSRGLMFNYESQTFAPVSFIRSAAAEQTVWDYGITFDTAGNVFADYNVPSAGGASIGIPADIEGLFEDGATYEGTIGYGHGGYGQGSYGGRFNGIG
jgi:hypothetical protein